MPSTNLIASGEAVLTGKDCDITGIAADSRKVEPGYLFCRHFPERRMTAGSLFPKQSSAARLPVLIPSPAKREPPTLKKLRRPSGLRPAKPLGVAGREGPKREALGG